MKIELKENLNPNKAKVGDIYTNNQNITQNYFKKGSIGGDYVEGKDLADALDKFGVKYQASSKLTTIKLLPENKFEVVSINPKERGRGQVILKITGTDLYFYLDMWNDAKKLYPAEAEVKAPKDREEVQYAVYWTPDIYGYSSPQYHWTSRDADETEKEFKNSVKYSAKRAAEREYREYNPNSIKTKYFSSKDTFLKFCQKIGLNPRLEESMKIVKESYDPDLLDELINYYASMDTMSADDIWNEIVDQYGDEDLANDVVESLDDERDSWYDDGNEEGYH